MQYSLHYKPRLAHTRVGDTGLIVSFTAATEGQNVVSLLDQLAEAHIQKAIEDGELDNLPGSGKPLKLEDDSMIPPELRAGYRLLKNSGFLPPELEMVREIREVESLIQHMDHGEEKERACARLSLLKTRLQIYGHELTPLLRHGDYRDKLLKRWDRNN